MKTKAYKLAAELGLHEQSVLEWLRANGYPNARRADTIRADVAQAARRALGRGRERDRRQRPRAAPVARGRGGAAAERADEGFKVSFAELLEAHLPSGVDAGEAPVPDDNATVPELPAVHLDARPGPPRADDVDHLQLRLAHAESERDQARRDLASLRVHGEKQAQELVQLREALAEAKRNLAAIEALRADVERLHLDRTRLRQQLEAAVDERATLEQTCTELTEALDDARQAAEAAETATQQRQSVKTDLDAAMQREMAWRARALELERASQDGANLAGLLEAHGLRDLDDQVRALRALLDARESAGAFVRALRNVDAGAIDRLVGDRLTRVCAHPICKQVAALGGRLAVRVDDEARCGVCRGSADRRWFARMVQECSRGGVRRLLVIGGSPATHQLLRELSQGQPVDLRLVAADEPTSVARAQGRVEGCDVLVVWSAWVVDPDVTAPYTQAADAQTRPVVSVLGRADGVGALARAVTHRLARNHVLLPR
ncbi:MAG: hypothetical protein H6704_15915 [Myxococcales bacterium]|nr:hypothetical protein [Myxococcales bacterium]